VLGLAIVTAFIALIRFVNELSLEPQPKTPKLTPVSLFQIIHEDQDLLVINKPAGLVCHPTKTDEFSSLISRARLHLGPNSRPHLVNRLDRETSGVTIVAKNSQTAGALGRIWETRQVEKEYLAIVHGHLTSDHGVIEAPLGKDETSRVAIKDRVRSDGAPARTEYRVLSRFGHSQNPKPLDSQTPPVHPSLRPSDHSTNPFSFLLILPHTGRKHQIRIHLAHIGHPIVGDKLYGGDEDLYLALVENRLTDEMRARLILPFHALHAAHVRFPWQGRPASFKAEPEPWLSGFLAAPA